MKFFRKAGVTLISVLLLSPLVTVLADELPANQGGARSAEQIVAELNDTLYADKTPYYVYKSRLGDKGNNTGKENKTLTSADARNADNLEIKAEFEGRNDVIITDESGSVFFDFDLEHTGFYGIRFFYKPILDEKNSFRIERRLLINNELPFFECGSVVFDRSYTSKNEQPEYDFLGNQLRPAQTENSGWLVLEFRDRVGSHDGLYEVYFEKGPNSIELASIRESMALEKIEIFEIKSPEAYSDASKGLTSASGYLKTVQAEDADRVNDIVLQPTVDRSSTRTVPYSVSNLRYNIIGQNFHKPGQRLEWDFEVPSDGLYNLSLRLRQYAKRELNAYIAVKVNGEIPYKECAAIPLPYEENWQRFDKTPDGAILRLPLRVGKNSVSIELVSSENAALENEIETGILRLNHCYKQIVLLTGSEPDKYRDYQFKKLIPDVLDIFRYEGKRLDTLVERIRKESNQHGSDLVGVENLAEEITAMAENPYTISERLSIFRTNLSAAATWLTTLKDIAVDVDSITLYCDDTADGLPELNDGFWDSLVKNASEFVSSFFNDYNSIGVNDTLKSRITVWVGSGRDQAQIVKDMATRGFTSEYKVGVDIRLVSNQMLMPSIMAGNAPDVALQQGNVMQQGSQGIVNQVGTLAVEWGKRGALYPLNNFSDYRDVLESRFYSCTYEPLGQDGVYYALPETQSFPVLYYRKDILREMGLSPPKTWDEVRQIIPVLQNSHMSFGFNYDFNNFCTLLYQNGGRVYNDDRSAVELDSAASQKAFKLFCEFSTVYKLPLKIDFNNRFRAGEMPVGISDISTFNVLQILAPEIDGLWAFAPVPGTLGDDGKFDDTVVGMVATSCFITNNTKNPEDAWSFIKWWTESKTQTEYSREIEAVLGPAGRNIPSGVEAFSNLPWTGDDLSVLETQLKKTREIPQPLGGYMVVRQFENAFRAVAIGQSGSVYNNGQDPRTSMLKYVVFMNQELKIKQNELNN